MKTLEPESTVDMIQFGVCYTHTMSGYSSLAWYDKMHNFNPLFSEGRRSFSFGWTVFSMGMKFQGMTSYLLVFYDIGGY